MVCTDTTPDAVEWKIGGSQGNDLNLNSEDGSDQQQLVPKASFDVEFSYSTSDDAGSAGPMADMFLMPSGIIQLTKVHVVSVENVGKNSTCTIRGHTDTSMAVKWNLAGFHFITAADIEARVIPQLSRTMFRQKCAHNSVKPGFTPQQKLQACCIQYNASEPDSALCNPKGEPIDSLVRHCSHEYPDENAAEYTDCMKIASTKEYMMFLNARK